MNKTELQKLIDDAPDGADIELKINGELAAPAKKPYELEIPATSICRLLPCGDLDWVSPTLYPALHRKAYTQGNTAPTQAGGERMQRWRKLNMLITSFIAKCNAELRWVADFDDMLEEKHFLVFVHHQEEIDVDYCSTYQCNPDIGVYFRKGVEKKLYDEFTPEQLSFWLTKVEGLINKSEACW